MPPKRKQKKNQKSGRQSEASSAAAAAASSSAVADSSAEDASLEFSEAHSRQHQTSTRRATMSSSTTSHRRSRSSVGSTRRGQGAIEDGVATPTPGRAPAGTAESRRQSFGSIRGRSATPHKPSRAREQKDLQHLNNRLENYGMYIESDLGLLLVSLLNASFLSVLQLPSIKLFGRNGISLQNRSILRSKNMTKRFSAILKSTRAAWKR